MNDFRIFLADPHARERIQHEFISPSSIDMGPVREHESQSIERVLFRSVLQHTFLSRADPDAAQRVEQIDRTIDR